MSKAPDVVVTDHALVRWLERVHGMRMEDYRAELAELIQPAVALGVKRITVGGFAYEFAGGYLKTVRPAGPGPNGHRRRLGYGE